MKIGVTGATGRLGRFVVQQLLERYPATDLVAIVRDPAKAADMAAKGVEIRAASYDDSASLATAVKGLDRLLLISSNEMGRRVQQHSNVIDAGKAAGVGLVVYTSAPQAPTSILMVAPEHKATEEYLTAAGVNYTVLRNNWYTENYLEQVKAAARSGEVIAAAGAGRVASATRKDYAEGAAAVLTGEGHENRVYELSGDHAWDFGELAAAVAKVTGNACTYRAVDPEEFASTLVAAGMDQAVADMFAALDGTIAQGALGVASSDLAELIGRPTTTLAESVREFLARE
jgi:NAD(P)H dehydrogenase (quinone)